MTQLRALAAAQDVVADDDLAALFGGDESSDNEDYDPSAAPQGSGSDAGGDSGDDSDAGEARRLIRFSDLGVAMQFCRPIE